MALKFHANTIVTDLAKAEGAAIQAIMRSLGNGEGHPICPACGLRIKSKGHFDQRVSILKRTWVQTTKGYFVEQFVEVDAHRTEALLEMARASEQSLTSLAAKFAK